MDKIVHRLASDIITRMKGEELTLATAESCSGGLISAALTEIAGASAVFTHGFVTYANEAKRDLLGVPQSMLDHFGAVSPQVAGAMAEGAVKAAQADRAIAVTGIAGPGGGTPDKPVGLVYIGIWDGKSAHIHRHLFPRGSRSYIRLLTVRAALNHLISTI